MTNTVKTISERNSLLLGKNFQKILLPRLSGKLSVALAALIDSVIASRFLGTEGLAAIGLVMPILSLDGTLHSFFGLGAVILYTRLYGSGQKKQADRFFTASLLLALLGYLIVCGLLLFFAKPIIAYYTNSPSLFQMTYAYYVPIVLAMPFFELALITESVFCVDGRPVFFSLRSIVTIPLNVALDLLFLGYYDMGTAGLAYATILSTTIGYLIPLSHIFSKKRTVKLSWDLFQNIPELYKHIKDKRQIGRSYAFGDILDTIFMSILNKLVMLLGGTAGMFSLSLSCKVCSVICKLSHGLSDTFVLLAGSLYGEKDYEGVGIILKTAIKFSLILGGICVILVYSQAETFFDICNITDPQTLAFCFAGFHIGTFSFPGIMMQRIFTDNLIISEKYWMYRIYCFVYNIIQLLTLFLLKGKLGMDAVWYNFAFGTYLSLLAITLLMKHKQIPLVPPTCDNVIVSTSTILAETTTSPLSAKVQQIIINNEYPKSLANRIALLIEGVCTYILHNNKKKVHMDLRIIATEKNIRISLCDDGVVCDPATVIVSKSNTLNNDAEGVLADKFSPQCSYNRITNLNYTEIDCAVK